MADKKQPKITVWLTRSGYKDIRHVEEMRNPEPWYVVQRTQNTTVPRILDRLDDDGIQSLIDKGMTVNIG